MGLIKKLETAAVIAVGTIASVGICLYGIKVLNDQINYDEKKAIVYQILDKDRKNGLSDEEKDVYFKATGFNPALHSISSPPEKDLDYFLKSYLNR
jgi:hypothetical protein